MVMFLNSLILFGPLAMLAIGVVLLWYLSWAQQQGRLRDGQPIAVLLQVGGWVWFILGILAFSIVTTWWFALVVWVAALVILIAAIHRYRNAEGRSLVWVLVTASERGIPLTSAARAFARERHGFTATRARRLAEYLEAAVPLSLALRNSRLRVPAEILLAADMGEKTGTLGASLRSVAEQWEDFDQIHRNVLEKIFYLGCLVLFGIFMLSFLLISIVPVFREMFEEFDLELPAPTVLLIEMGRFVAAYGFILAPLIMLCALLFIVAVLSYTGVSFRGLPGIQRVFAPLDRAVIMRMLAVGVRQKRPIDESLRLLAGYVPLPGTRARLDHAAGNISRGDHWCDALRRTRLIGKPESAVLVSAERAGNLAWALEEMAASTYRRFAQKARALANLAFPICVLFVGGCVLFVACSILLPLFNLIAALT